MKTDCKEIDFQKYTNATDDILQMRIHSRYVTLKNVTFVITKLFYYSLITTSEIMIGVMMMVMETLTKDLKNYHILR